MIDLGATINRYEYGQAPSPAEVDAHAIAADWYAVGNDLAGAMEGVAARYGRPRVLTGANG